MDPEFKLTKEYSKGPYNKQDEETQVIRITEGCPNQCLFCAETWENGKDPIYHTIPEITRNRVKILDMNLIYKPRAVEIIKELGQKKVNNKVVYYELQCGVDYRYMTQEIANELKTARFINIRIAWDYGYNQVYKIKDCIEMLKKAGYKSNKMQVFMICNWKISYEECLKKLDTLKFWNIQVSDCYFDNQLSPNIKPIHWTEEQIKTFRKKCWDHNVMCRFRGVQVRYAKK